jgi:Regulator of G protein signaling domain
VRSSGHFLQRRPDGLLNMALFLSNEEGFDLFKEFLTTEFSVENLLFFRDIQVYQIAAHHVLVAHGDDAKDDDAGDSTQEGISTSVYHRVLSCVGLVLLFSIGGSSCKWLILYFDILLYVFPSTSSCRWQSCSRGI